VGHLRARTAHITASNKAMLGWLGCAGIVSLFMAQAVVTHPLYVLLSGLVGTAFTWGLRHPMDGADPVVPVGTRVRIGIDAALVMVPAVVLLPLLVLALTGLDLDGQVRQAFQSTDPRHLAPVGVNGHALRSLGVAALTVPLVMAGLLYPPKWFSYRAMLPALPLMVLVAAGWGLGMTTSLLGSITIAALATIVMLATARLRWPDLDLDTLSDWTGLGRRGSRSRAARPPAQRLRGDFIRGVLRWSAIVIASSAAAAGLAVALLGAGFSTGPILVTVLPIVLLSRLLALTNTLDRSLLSTGVRRPFAESPLALLPVPRRLQERWSLLHLMTIGLVATACDLAMVTLGVASINTEGERLAGVAMMVASIFTSATLPWAAAAVHQLRFRMGSSGKVVATLVGIVIGAQATPFLAAIPYVALGYAVTQGQAEWMPKFSPIEMLYVLPLPGGLMVAFIWAVILGAFWFTRPKRATA